MNSFGKHSGRVSRLRPSLPQKHPRGRYHGATPYSTGGYTVTDDARKGFLSPRERRTVRSEEHTSELQSRLHLVCRLLLEKKKKNRYTRDHDTTDRHHRQ